MDGTEAPAEQWSVLPVTARQAGVIVRSVGLAVLVLAGVLAVFSVDPPRGDLQSLFLDVRAGKVRTVELQDEGGPRATARWSTGLFRWRSAPIDPDALASEADRFEEGRDRLVDVRATIDREARAAGHPVAVQVRGQHDLWVAQLPWPSVSWVAVAVWLVAFVWMLLSPDNRYANRWAWLWLFTFGTVGALLYLMLEPRTLWRPANEHDPARRMGGGIGLLSSWLLALLVSLGVLAVRQLFGVHDRGTYGELIVPVLTA